MNVSYFLAQYIGIYSLVMGSLMIVRKKMLLEIFQDLSQNRTVSFIMGVILMKLGLIVVLIHNIWDPVFPLAITLIGWGIFLEGILSMFFSKRMMTKYLHFLENPSVYALISFGYLMLGIYFSYNGFFG